MGPGGSICLSSNPPPPLWMRILFVVFLPVSNIVITICPRYVITIVCKLEALYFFSKIVDIGSISHFYTTIVTTRNTPSCGGPLSAQIYQRLYFILNCDFWPLRTLLALLKRPANLIKTYIFQKQMIFWFLLSY